MPTTRSASAALAIPSTGTGGLNSADAHKTYVGRPDLLTSSR